jgi:hypothetical protein
MSGAERPQGDGFARPGRSTHTHERTGDRDPDGRTARTARDAFTQGLQLAAIVSALLALALAVLTATLLRRPAPPGDETDTSAVERGRPPTKLIAQLESCGAS